VALAFEGSSGGDVAFDWHIVSKTISELLPQYNDISAVAVIRFTNKEKYHGDDIIEWLMIEIVPCFVVFHNRWLNPSINRLETSAFLDDYSFQLSPL
jgi:hypothetical protein